MNTASAPPFQDPPPPFNPEHEVESKSGYSQGAVPLFTAPMTDFDIGLRWTFSGRPIDLDVQAVFYDGSGAVVDACYYNQTSIFAGAVVHSGDETSGVKTGDDETIKIDLDKVPNNANIIAVLVTCYSEMDFRGVSTASATIRNHGSVLHRMEFGLNNTSTAFAVCLVFRASDGVWYFKDTTYLPEAFGEGRDFQQAGNLLNWMLDLVLPQHVRGVRSLSYRRSFDMRKGDRAGLPGNALTLKLGLGWEAERGCDLDASCISLDMQGNNIGCVYYQDLSDPGILHSGDNLTGRGRGDDEIITVHLTQLDSRVCQLVFLVTIYSNARSFSNVYDAYIRLMAGPQMKELAYFPLSPDEGGKVRGTCLVFARLYQTNYGWQFEALGEEANARTPKSKEAKEVVRSLAMPRGLSNTWRPTQTDLDSDLAVKWTYVRVPEPRVRPGARRAGGQAAENGDECCTLL